MQQRPFLFQHTPLPTARATPSSKSTEQPLPIGLRRYVPALALDLDTVLYKVVVSAGAPTGAGGSGTETTDAAGQLKDRVTTGLATGGAPALPEMPRSETWAISRVGDALEQLINDRRKRTEIDRREVAQS